MSRNLVPRHVPRLALLLSVGALVGVGTLAGAPRARAGDRTAPPPSERVHRATVEVTRRVPGRKPRTVTLTLGVAEASRPARAQVSREGLECRVALRLRPAADRTTVLAELDLAWNETTGTRSDPAPEKAPRARRPRHARTEVNLAARIRTGQRVVLGRVAAASGASLEVAMALR